MGQGSLEEEQKRLDAELEIKTISTDYSRERYDICKQCTHFKNTIKVCSICYCFMPGKTLIKSTSCPIGKW